METNESYVKILFRFYSDVLGEETVETMWAEIMDEDAGIYLLNSIPFYAPNLASGDVISAVYDDNEQVLTYKETVSFSGNSTIQVVLLDKTAVSTDIMNFFQDLGCVTEGLNEGYFVVDVPVGLDYSPVRAKLVALTEKGTIDYAEPCLSAEHGNA